MCDAALPATGFLPLGLHRQTLLQAQRQKGSWKNDLDSSNLELLNLNLKTVRRGNKQKSFYAFAQIIKTDHI